MACCRELHALRAAKRIGYMLDSYIIHVGLNTSCAGKVGVRGQTRGCTVISQINIGVSRWRKAHDTHGAPPSHACLTACGGVALVVAPTTSTFRDAHSRPIHQWSWQVQLAYGPAQLPCSGQLTLESLFIKAVVRLNKGARRIPTHGSACHSPCLGRSLVDLLRRDASETSTGMQAWACWRLASLVRRCEWRSCGVWAIHTRQQLGFNPPFNPPTVRGSRACLPDLPSHCSHSHRVCRLRSRSASLSCGLAGWLYF